MKETGKMQELRKGRGDFKNYLRGKGIDIGCGDDCLRVEEGTVRPWDVADGDAQLMAGIPDGEFDFVYSSHCLEHMRDVPETLKNWIRILKPGGFLYFVVPDYVIYEKMTWPSRFNGDHKQSFSTMIPRRVVARPNHFHIDQDLVPLLKELGMESVMGIFEDYGFNYNAGIFDQTRLETVVAQICMISKKR
jgi:ubiquinone/menaquinone biosynthesis C-methylase UbiE